MNISVNVLKEARGNLYQEHQRFQRSFDPRWLNDENIMFILSAISLFTPDRASVVHHDVVKLEQVKLSVLFFLVCAVSLVAASVAVCFSGQIDYFMWGKVLRGGGGKAEVAYFEFRGQITIPKLLLHSNLCWLHFGPVHSLGIL